MGLDVSTHTGCAVVDSANGSPYLAFQSEFGYKKGTKNLVGASHIAHSVLQTLQEYHPDLVVIEGYGFANKFTLVPLVEIGTVVRYFLMQTGKEYIEVAPMSLKKFVTGNGKAPKSLIMKEVYRRWGFDVASDNIADAIGLACFGLCAHGLLKVPAKNHEAVKTFVKKTFDKPIAKC